HKKKKNKYPGSHKCLVVSISINLGILRWAVNTFNHIYLIYPGDGVAPIKRILKTLQLMKAR
ncbi:MAG: hypothetical protein ACXVIY_12520, partial [Mucilaginibacter sp.]